MSKNPSFICNVLEEHYEEYRKMLVVLKIIYSEKSLENQGNEKLIELLLKFFNSVKRYDAYIFFSLFVENDLSKKLKEILEKMFHPDVAEKFYYAITFPIKENLIAEEKYSLLLIAKKMQRREDYETELSLHIDKFSWMANKFYDMTFYDRSHYLEQAEKLVNGNPEKELEHIETEKRKTIKGYQEAISAMQGDKQLLALCRTIQECVYFRNFRGERLYQSSFYLRSLLKEIGRRIGMAEKEVVYLTIFELIGLLKQNKQADKEEIKRRKKSFAFLTNVHEDTIMSGSELAEARQSILISERVEDNITELKGQKAYGGKVIGTVCLVLTVDDLKKIRQNDILVTPSTSPVYVPFLDKIKAIISNEGGILSHAAIISRELKIPSVILAKNATKIFKDGDFVEVDADNGIIRKI